MSLDKVASRVRNMVARAVLRLTDDGTTMQSAQVETQADALRDRVERMQDYGFTSVPHPGAEGVALAVGGSTGHTLLLAVGDRRYRMRSLAGGEVAVYDDLGQSVHLTRTGIVVKGAGLPVLITDTPEVTIDSKLHVTGATTLDATLRVKGETTIDAKTTVKADISAQGQIRDLDGKGGSSMSRIREVFNAHTHPENANTTTSRPNQQL